VLKPHVLLSPFVANLPPPPNLQAFEPSSNDGLVTNWVDVDVQALVVGVVDVDAGLLELAALEDVDVLMDVDGFKVTERVFADWVSEALLDVPEDVQVPNPDWHPDPQWSEDEPQ
jgi:hypothetical protein